MSKTGYIDFFEILKLESSCKVGDVKRQYKKLMKDLVFEISGTQLTGEKRNQYLLNMAQLNTAFYILRDNARRAKYEEDRSQVISLEEAWQQGQQLDFRERDRLRRQFDGALRDFLSIYMEELMLEAGRDPECIEASGWDQAHERHASRVLRLYRQRLYHEIHERLPFYDVSKPEIDWTEREQAVRELLTKE